MEWHERPRLAVGVAGSTTWCPRTSWRVPGRPRLPERRQRRANGDHRKDNVALWQGGVELKAIWRGAALQAEGFARHEDPGSAGPSREYLGGIAGELLGPCPPFASRWPDRTDGPAALRRHVDPASSARNPHGRAECGDRRLLRRQSRQGPGGLQPPGFGWVLGTLGPSRARRRTTGVLTSSGGAPRFPATDCARQSRAWANAWYNAASSRGDRSSEARPFPTRIEKETVDEPQAQPQQQRQKNQRRCRGEGRPAGTLRRAKRLSAKGETFTPVDVALAIGAGEPQVSKALLGLAAEGYIEKAELGKYRAPGMADLPLAEFLKAFARASRVDSTRQRDLSEITRLKQKQRHHEAAAADRHRGARPLPCRAEEARDRSRPAACAGGQPRAGGARRSGRRTRGSLAAVCRRFGERWSRGAGPVGLAVPSPASADAPSGPGATGEHEPSASDGPNADGG